MQQYKYNIQCDTLTPEQEFYQESYVFLEGAIIEVLSRLEIIRKYKLTKGLEFIKFRIGEKLQILERRLKECIDSSIRL